MLTNLCVLLPLLLSGRHSLTDIYTALSKPLRLPGIYEFIATGLLDGKMIDYFDSQTLRKALTQHWMSDGQREDYWDEDAQSRRSQQLWFKVHVHILMEWLRQNDSGKIHTSQICSWSWTTLVPDLGSKAQSNGSASCYSKFKKWIIWIIFPGKRLQWCGVFCFHRRSRKELFRLRQQ